MVYSERFFLRARARDSDKHKKRVIKLKINKNLWPNVRSELNSIRLQYASLWTRRNNKSPHSTHPIASNTTHYTHSEQQRTKHTKFVHLTHTHKHIQTIYICIYCAPQSTHLTQNIHTHTLAHQFTYSLFTSRVNVSHMCVCANRHVNVEKSEINDYR